MQEIFKIAMVQMRSSEDKYENLKLSTDLVKESAKKKASLICFPEFQMAFSPSRQSSDDLAKLAEPIKKGNFISVLSRSAKQEKIDIVATIYEKSDIHNNKNRVYDTTVIINRKGRISLVYRKLHLYDALGYRESDNLLSGRTIEKPAKTSIGNIGIMMCYDVRFPEMSRILTVNGADILVAPSAWVHGIMKEEHWQIMLKARAIENGSYVIAPNQVGNIYSGRTMVVDPFGIVLLDMGNREGMEIVEIDKSRVKSIRKILPLLKNRRIDVYRDNIRVFS